MERYSNLQLTQLKAFNNQIEARWTRTQSVALLNAWRQNHNTRNYTSGYARKRNEIPNSAVPFHTQEGLKKRTIELETMGANTYNIRSYFKF